MWCVGVERLAKLGMSVMAVPNAVPNAVACRPRIYKSGEMT